MQRIVVSLEKSIYFVIHNCDRDAQERAAAGMEGHGNAVWVTSADAQGAAKPLKATGNETLSY